MYTYFFGRKLNFARGYDYSNDVPDDKITEIAGLKAHPFTTEPPSIDHLALAAEALDSAFSEEPDHSEAYRKLAALFSQQEK